MTGATPPAAPPRIRVCVLMNRLHIGGNVLMNGIIDDPNMEIAAILHADISGAAGLAKHGGLLRRWREWTRLVGIFFQSALIIMTVIHFGGILLFRVAQFFLGHPVRRLQSLRELARSRGIPLIAIENINSPETLGVLRGLAPDIVLSNNFQQILRSEALAVPRYGCINMHPGVLPAYRGMMPFFWKMLHGRRTGGITLHYMDEGIDTGDIIAVKRFAIRRADSLYGVWRKTGEAGAQAVRDFIALLREKGNDEVRSLAHPSPLRRAQYFASPKAADAQVFRNKGNVVWHWRDLWQAVRWSRRFG